MHEAATYSSDELDAMAAADTYYRWILSRFRSRLTGTVLELGAGLGTFSGRMLDAGIEHLILVEPATTLCERVRRRFAGDSRVEVWHGALSDVRDRARLRSIRSIVAVNVLEHIRDDAGTLRIARDVLAPGGAVLLFVPALPALYGALDEAFGHVRRYTRSGLGRLLNTSGFRVDDVRYMNALGVGPWFVAGRVLRRRRLSRAMVRLADRTVVPLAWRLERVVTPPFGQSVIAIATKV